MIVQGKSETGPPQAERPQTEERFTEWQRGGFMGQILFPLIAIGAVAFSIYELL